MKEKAAAEVSVRQLVLNTIAARASTPPERLSWYFRHKDMSFEHTTQDRLRHFYAIVGATDSEKIAHCLTQYHLDEPQLVQMLSPHHDLEALSEEMSWIKQLEQIITQGSVGRACSPSADRSLLTSNPLPFEELLLPFVSYARQKLLSRCRLLETLLAEDALASLEHWLLKILSQCSEQAFQLEFSLFRAQQQLWDLPPSTCEKRDIYDAFLAQYQDEGFWPFFQEYSTLARLLVLLMEQWIGTCAEFVQHLATDYDELSTLFLKGLPLETVTELQANCSDPHHRGRTVFIVTFLSGAKLVYKPKNMKVDHAFSSLLSWFNKHHLLPDFKVLRVLTRSTYGWIEYAEQLPCSNTQDVKNYYIRAGMLLYLMYILGSTDMHWENIVASGEYPVIIDLETIIQPQASITIETTFTSASFSLIKELYQASVLRPLFLPTWVSHREAHPALDISGLGETDDHECKIQKWKYINRDGMCFREEAVVTQQSHFSNRVLLQDSPVKSLFYEKEIIEGFEKLHSFMAEHQDELLDSEGPLWLFKDCPLRIILRDTNTYMGLLSQLRKPDYLRDAADRWIEIQVLKRPLLENTDAKPFFIDLIEAELSSLEQLDVPYFTAQADRYDIWTDEGTVIPRALPVSAFERVKSCIGHIQYADIQRQVDLIRASFLTLQFPAKDAKVKSPSAAEEPVELEILKADALVEIAREIGLEISARACYNTQKDASWFGLQYNNQLKHFLPLPVGIDLYSGNCGIALFLAALEKITGNTQNRHLILSALQPLCRDLRGMATAHASTRFSWDGWYEWNIGGEAGLGGIIYALVHISRWLHLPELLDAARDAASLIAEHWITADQTFDIIGGSAGAILGLLTLYAEDPCDRLLEQALHCGKHLITHRIETASGTRVWPAFQQLPLAGFSHGAAGIAYALLHLAKATGQLPFQEAAEEAIHFEQEIFSATEGNWPNLLPIPEELNMPERGKFSCSWCHGASGVGLARLGGLSLLDTPQVRHDIQVALQTTVAQGISSPDNLCCGNGGRIDLFIVASQVLEQPEWLQLAHQWTSHLVKQAREQGGFHVLSQFPRQSYNPGLFQGYAGIGYQLLRAAFPQQLPSALLWI